MSNTSSYCFNYKVLNEFCQTLLVTAGANSQVARSISTQLLEADLLGFSTHGLQRLISNLTWLEKGRSHAEGQHLVIKQRAATQMWDGQFSSGLHLVPQAVRAGIDMAKVCGTGTILIKRVQHVACLASYLEPAIQAGMLVQIMASTPSQRAVAAYGGKTPVFSPNPFAMGAPGSKHPLIVDMTLATTAASQIRKAMREQRPAPAESLLDAEGFISSDASSFFDSKRSGAILPLGGEHYGYKGTALCLFSEIWTLALSNWGRAQQGKFGETNVAWIQVIDPEAFGELEQFKQEVDFLIDLISSSENREGMSVRAPGIKPLQRKENQMRKGVEIAHFVWQDICHWASQRQISVPTILTAQANSH